MKYLITLISTLLLLASAVYAQELTELVRLYGPEDGSGFYHICAPGDVNGDGYDDFIISSPTRDRNVRECENGYARLYFGSNPIDTSNYITIPAVCNEYQTPYDNLFGYHSAKVGDINNDGYPDFLIGDPGYFNYATERAGAGFVYFGGVAIDTLPSWQLIGNWWYGSTYYYGMGDVNGDQYNDVVMGITDHFPNMPAYLFLGGESPDTLYDFELGPYHPDSSVISKPKIIGDYNGDGIDDIIIGDPGYGNGPGMAYMFFGSETGFDNPDLVFQGRGGLGFGKKACGTDWNNDGFTDLFLGNSAVQEGSLFVYLGSTNPDAICDFIFTGEAVEFADNISGGGDLNRDGFPEFTITQSGWSGDYTAQGRVSIYLGSEEPDTFPDLFLYGGEEREFFGWETAFPGDINGDGYPEFIASSCFYFDQSRAFVTIFTTGNVSVRDDGQAPAGYDLRLSAYPNPFNSSANIEFNLPHSSLVKVSVYNLSGREVMVLEDSIRPKGKNRISWEGKDDQGKSLASGVYFVLLTTEYAVSSCKAVIIK